MLFHCTSPDSFLFHTYTIQSQSQFNLNKIYFFHLNRNSVQIIRYSKTTSQKQSTFKLTVFLEIVTSDSYSNPANNLINNCPNRKYALRSVQYCSVTSRHSPMVFIKSLFISKTD